MRLLVFYIVVLSVAIHGIEGGNQLCLSLSELADTYKTFIQLLRNQLSFGSFELYGVPILQNSRPSSERFFPIKLRNPEGTGEREIITLAIDALDLKVVGYSSNHTCYVFFNHPKAFQIDVLFSCASQKKLDYENDFESIEKAAGTTRLETPLGLDPLNSAISNLFHYREKLVPESFLVIIQMVLEAIKFRLIEQSVQNSFRDDYVSFKPGLAITSLEDNWSELSAQIQASSSLQGLFGKSIELYSSDDKSIKVDSIYYPIVISNIALQLHHCNVGNNVPLQNFIRMPGVGGDDTRNNDPCYVQTHTTRISGREGFCVDLVNSFVYDGAFVILLPCEEQMAQNWMFQMDGTIRCLGRYCLGINLLGYGKNVVVLNCDNATPKAIGWNVSIDGTITHLSSGLVLTANAPTSGTNLVVKTNTNASSQGWRVGDYVEPIIGTIIGLKDMCLEATNERKNIWLENCVKNKKEQYWALYSDSTIRVNENRSLCVTSTNSSSKLITILRCDGSSNQRWVFLADGTISNPKSGMKMDVQNGDVSLKRIVLLPMNGNLSQQWTLLY